TPAGLARHRFGLFPVRSPLLRESRLFSLPAATEMFHFAAFPSTALCVQAGMTGYKTRRVSPFGDPRIIAWLPAPRGLSQAPTSFIGSWCQGIHRVPLTACPLRTDHDATMLFSSYGRPPPVTASLPQSPTACRNRSAEVQSE